MADDERARPSLPTSVGAAIWGNNVFRGHAVVPTLAGHDGYWSAISLALGGPRLSADEAAVLDDIAVCCLAADPRIWPLKATQLGAAYGDTVMGMCVGMLSVDDAVLGPPAIGQASFLLDALARELVLPDDDDALVELLVPALERRITAGERLVGFGVPFRPHDERVVALRGCLERRGRTGGHHWRVMEAASAHLEQDHGLPANMGSAVSAAALDLGFSPDQIVELPWALLVPCFLANAAESAARGPSVLQRLPDACIEYVGPPRRDSPRACEATKRASGPVTTPTGPTHDQGPGPKPEPLA